MRTDTKQKTNKIVWELVIVGALLAFVAYSFFAFVRDNRRRIIMQNDSFIATAAEQMADRVDDLIQTSESNARLLASLYGAVIPGPHVDAELLQDMIDRSSFDYVEFISADGTDLTADGRTADLSDREYFLRGMEGQSGKCVVYNSRITNETLLIFYTPFRYEDEIIGVLSCIYRGNTVDDVLSSDYFGVQGSTYLLERSGRVILSVGENAHPENLLDYLSQEERISADDLQKLTDALDSKNNIDFNSFNYNGAKGAGSAYVKVLSDKDWVLVQSFPSSVTRDMTELANSAGVRLEVQLAAAFLVYVLFLVVKNRVRQKKLVDENQEMSGIVNKATSLFSRFALVDFQDGTYQYLGNKRCTAPERGRYKDLIAYLEQRYLTDSGDTPMSTVISQEYVQTHLTENVPYLQFEYQIDMDGRRWENISVLSLARENGVPVRVLFAIQDVTALKEREMAIREALQNASDAAEAANRAKSDFLARMSHDIRTPMNAIMGMTAVAAMHMDDPERLTDCLSKITVSSRHLLALINDVLDMSKIESGKVVLSEEPFGMADMVDSVVTIIKGQVSGKRQHLKVHIENIQHEKVIGDTLRLRQIFVNILGNAVKFTPEGGTITFSIRELPSRIHDMGCFEFVCQDTGIGMDQEFLKTIFDPFTRSKNSVSKNIEGTGLGMSITRNIVQMMDGDIQVESQLGVGSTFTVQVHLRLQEAEAEDIESLRDLRVLVADDDTNSCVSTCEILQSIGMTAQWVTNGDAAIEAVVRARDAGESFAAAILDWKMPGKDGVATAREIRKLVGEELPIIILSAYDWTDVEDQAKEAGIHAFIGKPLFRSRLIYTLRSVLEPERSGAALEPDKLPEERHRGKRVLLVEDNELNREIAVELLSQTGVTVEQAGDGQEALDMVANSPEGAYDLIFMDIQMPVMDGYEAARHIRALERADAKKIPIIAMTANAFSDDIRRAHDAGMNDHMAKPVEVAKLMEALDRWL